MRCLKRWVACEIFDIITNPPTVPTGHEIRQRRPQAGVALTSLVNTLDIAPIRLPRIERGLDFSNDTAHQAHLWLTQNSA